MNAGRLRDKIQIEERVLTGSPQVTVSWAALYELWATPVRQSETSANFTIRYNAELAAGSHRIIWDSIIWDLISITHDLKRTMSFITSDFSQRLEITHLQSVDREFIEGSALVNPADN